MYAYPFEGFRKDLTVAGQLSLTAQYEEACREGQIVVFVRDNQRRKLVSYSISR